MVPTTTPGPSFNWSAGSREMNQDPWHEKLSEGIRNFAIDQSNLKPCLEATSKP